eukprot:TRINITY_DN6771_c0_g1_i1.p1 TRINITY_DN6771_c0_g1~~TRINITY_DN6771_c0_g1_i1.p1  ORF type:complete len:1130 (-),score=217.77 TRINITY_DN6771_c0_g1_i1:296-3685(-)
MGDYSLYSDLWKEIFKDLFKPKGEDPYLFTKDAINFKNPNESIELDPTRKDHFDSYFERLRDWKSTRRVSKQWKGYADEFFRFEGDTLLRAIMADNREGILFLCKREGGLNPSLGEQYFLDYAITFDKLESVKALLLDERVGPSKRIPLMMACESDRSEIMDVLLKDPRFKPHPRQLMLNAVHRGRLNIVKVLINDDRFNAVWDAHSFQNLGQALTIGYYPMVKYVLENVPQTQNFICYMTIYSNWLVRMVNNEEPERFPQFDEAASFLFSRLLKVAQNEEEMCALFDETCDLEASCYRYISGHTREFFNLILEGLKEDKARGTKEHALQCLVSWSKKQPVLIRKLDKLLETPLKVIVDFIRQDIKFKIDENGEPCTKTSSVAEDSATDGENQEEMEVESRGFEMESNTGEEILDNLCNSIGGKYIGNRMLDDIIPVLLSSTKLKERGAGLRCLEMIVEGCPKEVVNSMPVTLNRVMEKLEDTDPRIRWMAIEAIAIAAKYLKGENFVKNYHSVIFPKLFQVIQDDPLRCIHNLAAGALWNLLEDCDADLMMPTVIETGDILLRYFSEHLSNTGHGVFDTISRVTQLLTGTAEEEKLYEKFVPSLKTILFDPNTKFETQNVVLDNITWLMANSEGREVNEDAKQILQFASEKFNKEDLRKNWTQLPVSLGRLCMAMKKDFIPYLKHFLDILVDLIENTPEECEDIKEGVKNGLFVIAEVMKGEIVPFIDSYFSVLDYVSQEGLTEVGRAVLPPLFSAVVEHYQSEPDVLNDSIDRLKSYLFFFQGEIEDLQSEIDRLKEITEVGIPFFDENDWSFVASVLEQSFGAVIKRRIERREWREQGLIDEEQEEKDENMAKLENSFVETIGETLTNLIISMKEKSVTLIDQTKIGFYLNYLKDTEFGKLMTVFVFCDLVEHAKMDSLPYFPTHYPSLIEGLDSRDQRMIQACSYGVGVIAEYINEKSFEDFPLLLKKLMTLLTNPREGDEWIEPMENAVNAVGKLLLHHENMAKCEELNQIYDRWLIWLPPRDKGESKSIFNVFCTMIERENTHLFGENRQNLPKIIRVLAQALASPDLIDEKIEERIKAILKGLDSDLIQQVSIGLDENVREKLDPFVHPSKRRKLTGLQIYQ